jgi:hypothetical protein
MDEQNEILEFGIKRENEERRDGGCAVVFDPNTKLYAVGKHESDGFLRLFSGGVETEENIKDGVLREVVEESGLNDFLYIEKISEVMTHYYNSLKNVNRVGKATCFLVILGSRHNIGAKLEDHEKFYLDWAKAEDILLNWNKRPEDNRPHHWIYFLNESIKKLKELEYINT